MNLIEATKSGKRFRRKPSIPGTVSWIGPLDVSTHWGASFRLDDMLAEDWEVEKTPVAITESDFLKAWERAVDKAGGQNLIYGVFESFRDLVAKELGL